MYIKTFDYALYPLSGNLRGLGNYVGKKAIKKETYIDCTKN